MNGRTLWKRFTPLMMVLVVLLIGGGPSAARAGSLQEVAVASPNGGATIQGCLDVSSSSRSFTAWNWTPWFYGTASTRCADLNVKISDVVSGEGCDFLVDAQYYKSSQGQWIDGANDDFWMLPNLWYTPLTTLIDGTQVRVRFQPSCTTSGKLWIAL